IAFAAALILSSATAATARLTPIRLPHMGERVLPRVRHGVIRIPAGHASGRVTVIADLKLAPLAQAYGRGFAAQGSSRKLSVQSAGAHEYLARIAQAQRVAAAQIRAAIPQARIQNRYRVGLNGFALRLPYGVLPALEPLSAG